MEHGLHGGVAQGTVIWKVAGTFAAPVMDLVATTYTIVMQSIEAVSWIVQPAFQGTAQSVHLSGHLHVLCVKTSKPSNSEPGIEHRFQQVALLS